MTGEERRSGARLRNAAKRAEALAAEASDSGSDPRQVDLARGEQRVAQQLGATADTLRDLANDLEETRNRMAANRTETEQLAADLRAAADAVRDTRERVRRTGAGRRTRPRRDG